MSKCISLAERNPLLQLEVGCTGIGWFIVVVVLCLANCCSLSILEWGLKRLIFHMLLCSLIANARAAFTSCTTHNWFVICFNDFASWTCNTCVEHNPGWGQCSMHRKYSCLGNICLYDINYIQYTCIPVKTSLTHYVFSVWLVFQGALSWPFMPQLHHSYALTTPFLSACFFSSGWSNNIQFKGNHPLSAIALLVFSTQLFQMIQAMLFTWATQHLSLQFCSPINNLHSSQQSTSSLSSATF